jgi:lysophospholipase L1-like esterase
MHAKNGSDVQVRTRGYLLGCLTTLALALCGLVLAAPAANATGAEKTTTYLALGDSISFGYTQEVFNNHQPNESPSYFEEGFANGFARDLKRATEVGKSLRLVNDGCPGETSSGLIGENGAVGGQTSTESYAEAAAPGGYQGLGDWHPCAYAFFHGLPLHNSLGNLSQLEDATQVLAKENVKAITLNIGSNDELAAVKQCEDEVAPAAVPACVASSAPNVTFPAIIEHVQDILGVLDGAGYKGPIIVLGYYNPDSFVLQGSDSLQKGLNKALETEVVPGFDASVENNVTFANPFPTFNKGAGATEQRSICKYTEMCNPSVQTAEGENPGSPVFQKDGDVHPTLAGDKALAKLVNAAYLANPAK